MQAFPLIDALWASLDRERPSGDDPARVLSALRRFYIDFQRAYLQGRRNRWKTSLFLSHDGLLRERLERMSVLLAELDRSESLRPDEPLLAQLRSLDLSIRESIHTLGQEEVTFGIQFNESPKLMQLDYLFEGWSRGLLTAEPVEEFLTDFQRHLNATRTEIAEAGRKAKARDKESDEETSAIAHATDDVEKLDQTVSNFLESLGGSAGAAACRPLRDEIFQTGQSLGAAFHRLEQCSPVSEPCPFCGGQLSLSGRCRGCGRRMPHLEDVEAGDQPQLSDFASVNLRQVDLALLAWQNEPDNEDLWRDFQDEVRNFGKIVDAGKQQVQMLETAPDRPIDPASRERLDEAELKDISAAFVAGQRVLSTFAFQSFPPEHPIADDWREPLLAIEPRMQALETRYLPQETEPVEP